LLGTYEGVKGELKMRLFIWIVFCVGILGVLLRAKHLCKNEYPRREEYEAPADVIGLLIQVGLIVWAAILLFN
jgi:hypothetical protein